MALIEARAGVDRPRILIQGGCILATVVRDYIEWQDRSSPVAFFITIRCYGTWLHGDERGSMDREDHNIYGAPKIAPRVAFEESDRKLLKHPPVLLDDAKCVIVETAIREFADHRKTTLHALNIRTNHAHIVIGVSDKHEKLMTALFCCKQTQKPMTTEPHQ